MKSRIQNTTSAAVQLILALAYLGVALVGSAVDAAGAIVANLEHPTSANVSSGIGNVQGWAFPTRPGDEIDPVIDVYIDGQFALEIPCCSDRGDVQAAYPNAPLMSGFGGSFNFQALAPGQHTLEARIYSKLGDSNILSTSFTSETIGTFAFNRYLDFDDSSTGHCTPSNVWIPGQADPVARLICSGIVLENGQGETEHCTGQIELTWVKWAQGFRLTKGCEFGVQAGLLDPKPGKGPGLSPIAQTSHGAGPLPGPAAKDLSQAR